MSLWYNIKSSRHIIRGDIAYHVWMFLYLFIVCVGEGAVVYGCTSHGNMWKDQKDKFKGLILSFHHVHSVYKLTLDLQVGQLYFEPLFLIFQRKLHTYYHCGFAGLHPN